MAECKTVFKRYGMLLETEKGLNASNIVYMTDIICITYTNISHGPN